LIFGADKVTTGASNDIERATKMARNMATKWGLSDELGPITYVEDEDEVFLGRSVTQHKSISNETASKIDEVVRGILDRAYARTTELLITNLDKLHVMANALLQYETIDAFQIDDIMAGREPGPPADWVKSASTTSTPPPPPKSDAGSAIGKVGDPATQSRTGLDG
jgi:cell division protease FtsH